MGWTWAAGVNLRPSECSSSPNWQAQRGAGGAGPGESRRGGGRVFWVQSGLCMETGVAVPLKAASQTFF